MSKKTVLVLPRHLPKSGVRDEKIFLKILFIYFFGGGVGRSEGVIEARKTVLNPSYYILLIKTAVGLNLTLTKFLINLNFQKRRI